MSGSGSEKNPRQDHARQLLIAPQLSKSTDAQTKQNGHNTNTSLGKTQDGVPPPPPPPPQEKARRAAALAVLVWSAVAPHKKKNHTPYNRYFEVYLLEQPLADVLRWSLALLRETVAQQVRLPGLGRMADAPEEHNTHSTHVTSRHAGWFESESHTYHARRCARAHVTLEQGHKRKKACQ